MGNSVEVLLRAERHDGNDPIEAKVVLPAKPNKGDLIAVWNPLSGFTTGSGYSGEEQFLEVETVVLSAYWTERIEVWVKMEGYDLMALEQTMKAAEQGVMP